MNSTDLATLSMSQLKAFCLSHSLEPVGDKRLKATYILSIETFQSEQTVIEIIEMPAMPDPFESESIDLPVMKAAVIAERSTTPLDLYIESDGSPTFTPQPTAPKPHLEASIVVLIPLILMSVAVISIFTSFRALIHLIEAVGQVSVSIWRSIPRSTTSLCKFQSLFTPSNWEIL
jgi:hypothetical protein